MKQDRTDSVLPERKIITHDMNLLEFINKLAAGEFLIPSFQRHFVWEQSSIIKLWDSIYHFYPIGSILYWKTDIRLKIHRKLGGFVISRDRNTRTEKKEKLYILDGQQRTTSLFVSYFGGKEHINKQNGFDYTTYFDATSGTFFFENELYKRKWDINPAFLLRLKDVVELDDDGCNKLSIVHGYTQTTGNNLLKLNHSLKAYRISLTGISGYDITGVCKIFERINNAGKSLENLDILVARSFKDNPLIVEET